MLVQLLQMRMSSHERGESTSTAQPVLRPAGVLTAVLMLAHQQNPSSNHMLQCAVMTPLFRLVNLSVSPQPFSLSDYQPAVKSNVSQSWLV